MSRDTRDIGGKGSSILLVVVRAWLPATPFFLPINLLRAIPESAIPALKSGMLSHR